MTHDPYQTFPTFPALGNPFGSPYSAMQTSAINPALAFNPLAAQQLGAQGIQGIQSPYTNAWQNPFQSQNPFQNHAAIQNPLLNPILAQLAYQQLASQLGAQVGAQQYSPFQQPYAQQQIGHPLAGLGQPGFNQQMAPQTWVGQAFAGQGLPGQGWQGQGPTGQFGQPGGGYGQVNPVLLQLAVRALQGANPWAAF